MHGVLAIYRNKWSSDDLNIGGTLDKLIAELQLNIIVSTNERVHAP